MGVPLVLSGALGIALVAIVGIWYALEGREIVAPLSPDLSVTAKGIAGTMFGESDLPALYLDIESDGYRMLERQRDQALQKGILQLDDENWVRAQIRFRDEAVPVEVRLKGDWIDRLEDNKWPFQVKVRDEALTERETTILGMRSFSLQSPAASAYLNEWLYMEDLRRTDVLVPRYYFARVYVNGDDWGMYALQEGVSPDLLKSQGRSEGVIVHLDGSLFWRHRSLFYDSQTRDWDLELSAIASTFELAAFAPADEFDALGIQGDPVFSEHRDAALGLLRAFQRRQLPASQVFDAEKMGQYLAHTNLWGARDGLKWHNEWYFYDPGSSRLEPIAHDAFTYASVDTPFVDLAQYEDLEIMTAYAREVLRISKSDYLDELRSAYTEEFDRYYVVLGQEFASMELETPWSMLPRRQELLLNSLHPPQTVHAYQVGGELKGTVKVQVCNLVRYPVALRTVRTGDHEVGIEADWILEHDSADVRETLIHDEAMPSVVLKGVRGDVPECITLGISTALLPQETYSLSGTLQIVTNLVGVDEQVVVTVRAGRLSALSTSTLPTRPSIKEALMRYPFLRLADRPRFLEPEPGTWHVEGDLVLPDGFGLQALQPVTLTFDRKAILFSDGPLVLGSDEGEIRLLPERDYWGGLVVLQAGPQVASSFHNVEIRATSGVQRDGWMTSGGVTFYESPVVFSHCRLRGSIAKAAVHLVRSEFEFVHTEFEDAASDALLTDSARGRVEQCTFHNVREDGIDASRSRVAIQDISLLRVYGKGISADDGSVMTVGDVRVADAYAAIVSQDMSSVYAQGVRIARAWVAGFAAYEGNLGFEASIDASNVVFEDDSVQTLAQKRSSIAVNGEVATARELDVDELYRHQRALASMRDLNYQFGSEIRLVGYRLAGPEFSPGDALPLTLYWYTLAELDRDYTVFVHVLDASGQTVTGWDNMPCQDVCPTTLWRVGRLVEDVHLVPLPPEMPAGEYRVALGLYYWPTGERLPVSDPGGDSVPDARLVLAQTIKVKQSSTG